MFQSQPYIQVSTGYAIPHSLPDYTFEETPLRLSDGRRPGSEGASGSAANALFYGTSIFSAANGAGIGPAPSPPGTFDFHATSSTAAASTVPAPAHHRPSLPLLPKMESNTDDLVAQEAAAREYQPRLEVNPSSAFTPAVLLPGTPRSPEPVRRCLQGPLVGKKTPSTAITEEYAKADPIYVQKTMVGSRCKNIRRLGPGTVPLT